MLSRVAESMFWMSRYIERAENTARFLDVSFHLRLDLSRMAGESGYWEQLIHMAGNPEQFGKLSGEYTPETVTEYLVLSRENPLSVASSVAFARENARSIIESISSEMWEQVNGLYHVLQNATVRHVAQDPYKFYKEIKNGSHLFQGITDGTMLRTESWQFVQIGKFIERAINTAQLVDIQFARLNCDGGSLSEGSAEMLQWMGVLKSCSALEAFCKVHLGRIDPDTVLRFLVLDRAFPRSIYFSVNSAESSLWNVSGSSRQHYLNSADRQIGKMGAELTYATLEDIREAGLHPYLGTLQDRLWSVANQIHRIYFAYHIPDSDDHEHAVLPRAELAQDMARRTHAEQQQQTPPQPSPQGGRASLPGRARTLPPACGGIEGGRKPETT
jgi:uncharacterized alpha-E superfamily protein